MGFRGFRRRGIALGGMAIAAAAMLGAAMLPASPPPRRHAIDLVPARLAIESDLSVMTYNVKGLPWPLAAGRTEALTQMAECLRGLRAAGRHPRIVLVQEAFTDAAKRIGEDSGYRYIASGPGRDLAPAADDDPRHIAFIERGDPFRGEGVGKLADSGLQILSDYPILAVRRAAFPAHACAGFDCLANKGMVMVLIRVPGLSSPVAVINTHFNARKASGVSIARSLEAYQAQIAALGAFIRANVPADVPLILGGDLNVGKSPERRGLIQAGVTRWVGPEAPGGSGGVLRSCFSASSPCGADLPADARQALHHNKDWQVIVPADGAGFAPHGIAVPFGREADGTMLSDHVGYAVYYRFEGQRQLLARR